MHRYSLLLALMLSCVFQVGAVEASSEIGKVLYASEPVFIERHGQKIRVKRNMFVYQSDVMITGYRGRIKLRMNDRSVVFLGSESRLSMRKFDMSGSNFISASFNLFWGKARFMVNKLMTKNSSFDVNTTTAVLGVRGTEFVVSSEASKDIRKTFPKSLSDLPPMPTKIVLAEGAVDVSGIGGKIHRLTPGHSAFVKVGGFVEIRRTKHNDLPARHVAPAHDKADDSSSGATDDHNNQPVKRPNAGGTDGDNTAPPAGFSPDPSGNGMARPHPIVPPTIDITPIQQDVNNARPSHSPIGLTPIFVLP